jgi:hypothetical protein
MNNCYRPAKQKNSLGMIIDDLHKKHEREVYELMNSQESVEFKATDIYYKIPYADAIRKYSDNYNKCVFKVDYKDISKIVPQDPVYDILLKDCLINSRGKTTHSKKDPYCVKLGSQDLDKKKAIKMKNVTIGNLKKENLEDHNLGFDSNFECGNLHSAIKISNTEYHLFIHPDTNTAGHTQWFYFKVTGMVKDVDYNFKIMNFKK